MEALIKNLWLLLTLGIPGMTTYGVFRLFVLLHGSQRIDKMMFEKIDASALVTSCLIIALAVSQQAVAIVIEAVISSLCLRRREKHEEYYVLFCERFEMAARGKLSEDATRILGNFFLSLNVTIGQILILVYLFWYEKPATRTPEYIILGLVGMGFTAALFRLGNAVSAVRSVELPRISGNKRRQSSVLVSPL